MICTRSFNFSPAHGPPIPEECQRVGLDPNGAKIIRAARAGRPCAFAPSLPMRGAGVYAAYRAHTSYKNAHS